MVQLQQILELALDTPVANERFTNLYGEVGELAVGVGVLGAVMPMFIEDQEAAGATSIITVLV